MKSSALQERRMKCYRVKHLNYQSDGISQHKNAAQDKLGCYSITQQSTLQCYSTMKFPLISRPKDNSLI